jgi:hypothetical protein
MTRLHATHCSLGWAVQLGPPRGCGLRYVRPEPGDECERLSRPGLRRRLALHERRGTLPDHLVVRLGHRAPSPVLCHRVTATSTTRSPLVGALAGTLILLLALGAALWALLVRMRARCCRRVGVQVVEIRESQIGGGDLSFLSPTDLIGCTSRTDRGRLTPVGGRCSRCRTTRSSGVRP